MKRILVITFCAAFCAGCQPAVQKGKAKIGKAMDIEGRSFDEEFLAEKRRGLKHEDPAVRAQTIDSVVKEGPGLCGHFHAELVGLLEDGNPKVRSKAAAALGRAGSRAREAVDPLRKRLDDGEVEVASRRPWRSGRFSRWRTAFPFSCRP